MTDRPLSSASAPEGVRPEFSRQVRADRVHDREMVETIEAGEAERRALAERFELEAINRLTATVRLRRLQGGPMIRVVGNLEADVVQTCGVTLEPVPAHISEEFTALFSPDDRPGDDDEDLEFDMEFGPESEFEDGPEPLENGRIDIGELTAQHLSLALDPYPRADGEAFIEHIEHEEEEEKVPNPFAALARRRDTH